MPDKYAHIQETASYWSLADFADKARYVPTLTAVKALRSNVKASPLNFFPLLKRRYSNLQKEASHIPY